jgi:hypothetical protein
VAETVGGTTTKYLVDTVNPTGYAQVIDELVSGAVTRTYAYGQQRISENQKIGTTQTASFYGYDGHGNVRYLTDSAGTATDTYVYDAFGLPITTTGTNAEQLPLQRRAIRQHAGALLFAGTVLQSGDWPIFDDGSGGRELFRSNNVA